MIWGMERVATIYVLAGIGGNILSATFNPMTISVGASGSLFGLLGAMVVDVILHWNIVKRPWCKVFYISFIIIAALLFGLLPLIDNWAHVGGLIVGTCCAFIILRDVSPKQKRQKRNNARRYFCVIVNFLIIIFIMVYLIYAFYANINLTCKYCCLIDGKAVCPTEPSS